MNKENKMYNYLLEHNYISKNKKSNYQSELSIERAECIANKFNSLIEEENANLKQALNEIRKYLVNELKSGRSKDNQWLMGCYDEDRHILEMIDKKLGENNEK